MVGTGTRIIKTKNTENTWKNSRDVFENEVKVWGKVSLDEIQSTIFEVLDDTKKVGVLEDVLEKLKNKKVITDSKIVIDPETFPEDIQDLRAFLLPYTSIDAMLNSLPADNAKTITSSYVQQRNAFINKIFETIVKKTTKKEEWYKKSAQEMIKMLPSILRDFKIDTEGLLPIIKESKEYAENFEETD